MDIEIAWRRLNFCTSQILVIQIEKKKIENKFNKKKKKRNLCLGVLSIQYNVKGNACYAAELKIFFFLYFLYYFYLELLSLDA